MQDVEKKAVSIREFSEMMGISQAHAWRMCSTGEIPSFKIGKRHCIPMNAIDEMINGTFNKKEK